MNDPSAAPWNVRDLAFVDAVAAAELVADRLLQAGNLEAAAGAAEVAQALRELHRAGPGVALPDAEARAWAQLQEARKILQGAYRNLEGVRRTLAAAIQQLGEGPL